MRVAAARRTASRGGDTDIHDEGSTASAATCEFALRVLVQQNGDYEYEYEYKYDNECENEYEYECEYEY